MPGCAVQSRGTSPCRRPPRLGRRARREASGVHEQSHPSESHIIPSAPQAEDSRDARGRAGALETRGRDAGRRGGLAAGEQWAGRHEHQPPRAESLRGGPRAQQARGGARQRIRRVVGALGHAAHVCEPPGVRVEPGQPASRAAGHSVDRDGARHPRRAQARWRGAVRPRVRRAAASRRGRERVPGAFRPAWPGCGRPLTGVLLLVPVLCAASMKR